ncbi:MAG: SEC-C domain-containing protein [Microscillaceae bacterium]|nr:SEC-C domain-containing protein [Microscillaceae bacterium]
MQILSKQEAFTILENPSVGIPMEAIKFLYNYGPDEEILEKIIFALKNAYKDVFFDEEEGMYLDIPLWYAIVAENHLDIRLVDVIIQLFVEADFEMDFLSEQCGYLVGKLCETFGEEAIENFFHAIEDALIGRSDLPSLFLFDCFYFLDPEKYQERILNLLHDKNFYWKEALIIHLRHPKFIVFKPALEKILKEANFLANIRDSWLYKSLAKETQASINLMVEETDKNASDLAFSQTRENWESHYEKLQDHFTPKEDSEDEDSWGSIFENAVLEDTSEKLYKIYDPTQATKINRNAPCPCGSGKKYKKCCMP